MTDKKTVAEKLREFDATKNPCAAVWVARLLDFEQETLDRCAGRACAECKREHYDKLADAIEAEQAELRAENERLRRDFYEPCARMGFTEHARGIEAMCDALSRVAQGHECRVDFKALDLLCDKLECGDVKHRSIAEQIRKAVKGVPSWSSLKGILAENKSQLPEGIQWPRFTDGELVKIGDEITYPDGRNHKVKQFWFEDGKYLLGDSLFGLKVGGEYGEPVKRPEPEVLDADGVPIKVGDTVWYTDELPTKKFVGDRCTVKTIERIRDRYSIKVLNEDRGYFQYDLTGKFLTHRKPDTQEDINTEAVRIANLVESDCFTEVLDGINALLERQRKLMGGE